MKAVICCIAKKENEYINDWVNYHLALGFDHIYIHDNNDYDYEYIGDRIDNKNKVTIIDARDNSVSDCMQAYCYDTFYRDYGDTFDWCAFIDVDEFITLPAWNDNIKEFLSDKLFEGYDCIRLNMTTIGDDGYIEREMSVPLHKALYGRCNIDWLDFGGKQITKGHLNGMTFGAHCPYINGELMNNQITPSGKTGQFGNRIDERNENAYIRHYRTKTLKEFVEQKLNRTDACFKNTYTNINYFFESNDKTKEKIQWLRDRGINV